MCNLQELVQLVDDGSLAVPWLAATSASGLRVVFVRRSDEPLLSHYCALGPALCPVFRALAPVPRTVA